MNRDGKMKLVLLIIIIFGKLGFSQIENHDESKFAFQLRVNDGAVISAILEYEVIGTEEEFLQMNLLFNTIKMRKKLFKKDLQELKKITSSKSIKLTDELRRIILGNKILNLCQIEKDMSGMQTDGEYFHLQIKNEIDNDLRECSVLVDTSITSKESNELGELISKILLEIRYSELEEEFKESLSKGYYYNNGHYYWKKK